MRISLIKRGLIAVGIASLLLAFYNKGSEIAVYQHQIAVIEAKKALVQKEIENLTGLLARKDDMSYLEFLARRELGLILPGEEKYIIIEGP